MSVAPVSNAVSTSAICRSTQPRRRRCTRKRAQGRFSRSLEHADPGSHTGVSGQRYYSPSQGRFLGRDPIEEKGGLHLYGFVGNNPVNRWDLLGMYYLMEEKDGVTIVTVPLVFASGTTKEQKDEFMTVARLTWGGPGEATDGRSVVVNVVELPGRPSNSQAYNTVNILDLNPDVRSNTVYRGADQAAVINLNINARNVTNLIGHELGHVLGNQDRYEVLYRLPDGREDYLPAGTLPPEMIVQGAPDRPMQGGENNVMGTPDTNRIDKRNYDEMLSRPKSLGRSPGPIIAICGSDPDDWVNWYGLGWILYPLYPDPDDWYRRSGQGGGR